jgi:hypothetical protein
MPVYFLDNLWYPHGAQIQRHFLAVFCTCVLALIHDHKPNVRTELDA